MVSDISDLTGEKNFAFSEATSWPLVVGDRHPLRHAQELTANGVPDAALGVLDVGLGPGADLPVDEVHLRIVLVRDREVTPGAELALHHEALPPGLRLFHETSP
jgi:hypothetical protein